MNKRDLQKSLKKLLQRHSEWMADPDKAFLLRELYNLTEIFFPKLFKATSKTVKNVTLWLKETEELPYKQREKIQSFLKAFNELLAFLQMFSDGSMLNTVTDVKTLMHLFEERIVSVVNSAVDFECAQLPLEKNQVKLLYESLSQIIMSVVEQRNNQFIKSIFLIEEIGEKKYRISSRLRSS
ncbi:MAG: hypothetical protein ACLQT6_12810 [Desulfomonilaceae bacterium]